jgi:SAM-dependent methyltransferase
LGAVGYRGLVANEAEVKRWNDPGRVAWWTEREKLTEAVSPVLVRVIGARAGQRVCDVGCGGGSLTIELAGAVAPNGEVVGLDISAPLLELARSRADAAGRINARFVEADVQTTRREEGPFDAVVSQFGVMFFDEPLVAFRSIRRRLTEEGRFVFACWQDCERNPWHVRTALRALLPPPVIPGPGKSPVGPFVLGDDEYVRDLLLGAGFGVIESTAHHTMVRGTAGVVAAPAEFRSMGLPAERHQEALNLVERHLTRFAVGPDQYEYPLAFRVYDARPR